MFRRPTLPMSCAPGASLAATPSHAAPTARSLSKLLGFQLYLKFENYQPIGAFKVRGG